jgi:hypothetical protein
MSYIITEYSKQKAKQLNVTIKPSTKKNKKIDVYKDGQLISSIGSKNYKDYPTYIKEKGKQYADERRRLYKIRHKNDLNSGKGGAPTASGTSGNGYYANKILW